MLKLEVTYSTQPGSGSGQALGPICWDGHLQRGRM